MGDFVMTPSPTRNHPDKQKAERKSNPEAAKAFEEKLENVIANMGNNIDIEESTSSEEVDSKVVKWLRNEITPAEDETASQEAKREWLESELAKNASPKDEPQQMISPSPTPPIEAQPKQEETKELVSSAVESNPQKESIAPKEGLDIEALIHLLASKL